MTCSLGRKWIGQGWKKRKCFLHLCENAKFRLFFRDNHLKFCALWKMLRKYFKFLLKPTQFRSWPTYIFEKSFGKQKFSQKSDKILWHLKNFLFLHMLLTSVAFFVIKLRKSQLIFVTFFVTYCDFYNLIMTGQWRFMTRNAEIAKFTGKDCQIRDNLTCFCKF
jgi:hypothetical protein